MRLEDHAQWVAATSCRGLGALVRQQHGISRRHVQRIGYLLIQPNTYNPRKLLIVFCTSEMPTTPSLLQSPHFEFDAAC